ncbi:MAG: hypothetical protein P4L69_14040 [Desulfosporosinus sp.]|nr:hypothetical protein [Desulfosporosinus sp.]
MSEKDKPDTDFVKTEEAEITVLALAKLMEQVEQLQQEKISLQNQVKILQTELSKSKDLLDLAHARISDISQEKEKEVQQAQETAKKDIDQLKHMHQLTINKAATEADRRVLEAINQTKDEYTSTKGFRKLKIFPTVHSSNQD